jgi:hypothetical protein
VVVGDDRLGTGNSYATIVSYNQANVSRVKVKMFFGECISKVNTSIAYCGYT